MSDLPPPKRLKVSKMEARRKDRCIEDEIKCVEDKIKTVEDDIPIVENKIQIVEETIQTVEDKDKNCGRQNTRIGYTRFRRQQ